MIRLITRKGTWALNAWISNKTCPKFFTKILHFSEISPSCTPPVCYNMSATDAITILPKNFIKYFAKTWINYVKPIPHFFFFVYSSYWFSLQKQKQKQKYQPQKKSHEILTNVYVNFLLTHYLFSLSIYIISLWIPRVFLPGQVTLPTVPGFSSTECLKVSLSERYWGRKENQVMKW